VIIVELILEWDVISQSSAIVVSQTVQVTFSSRYQKYGGVRGNCLTCGDASPWRCWLPLDKRRWKCWSSVHFYTQGLINCCTVACARVVECAQAYAKVCLLYCVRRHVTLTEGWSMTNGANYKRGKLNHSPWHSDIHTSNQLNKLGRHHIQELHQQKIFPSGRNDSVRVDRLRQSRQRHLGGGILRGWPQYHASRCTSSSDRCFTIFSCHAGLQFWTNTQALKANCDHT